MFRFGITLSASLVLLTIASADAHDLSRTDANLVTAIDVSGSIDPSAERIELLGMADALVNPAVLQAIREGVHRRIGFVAFTWSSQGDFVELVPWTLIGSRADATRVADLLRAARSTVPVAFTNPRQKVARTPWRTGLGTDVSATIEHAMDVLSAAPFASERGIINVCANGKDNISGGPEPARDWAAARGLVINAVVLNQKDDLADYFRENVQTGPGSFVLHAREPTDVAVAMLRKFVTEIAWLRLRPGQARAG